MDNHIYGKYKKLLGIMVRTENDWITAADLSVAMTVSIRSVKSYLSDLNAMYHDLIQSSNKGYKINRILAKQLLSASGTERPYTPQERVRFILKKLLAAPYESLDIFQLSEEELFVSLETVKKDLSIIRKRLHEFDLYIITTGFDVVLEGSELDKRKMLSNILYEEFSENVFSLTAVEKVFPQYNVKYIYNTILEACKRHRSFVNEYSLMTLLLDIVISIDRIKNDYTIPYKSFNQNTIAPEYLLARDIASHLEEYFHITYNEIELNEIMTIIISNLIKTDSDKVTMKNIDKYVDTDCNVLIQPLSTQMANFGFIDVNNDTFMTRFMLHINNLLMRLKNNYERKNPLIMHIKTSCPMLFECAVTLSDIINKKTGYRVGEHETVYIALHIGSLLSTHLSMRNKISCVLLFPSYYDYGEKLTSQLTGSFDSMIVIQGVIAHLEELQSITAHIDLVISVVQIPHFFNVEFVCVNPFMTEYDFNAIRLRIEKIRQHKKKQRLFEHLKQISGPAIFNRNIAFQNEDEAIRYMAALMIENGYAGEAFEDEVLSREHSYSTAYRNIAIPHSMQMSAKKTGMAVMINEKPIPWGQNMVNIVLLFTIEKETQNLFYDIFDNLITLLLEASNAAKITECKTYDDFIKTIIDCL
ncbi:MAG: PTS sugar transporter subunit IIA [Treponema sp.]|jgi:lichenan operon transcriptional antiterminator|nr:PTS sugar transporter subunit IIA [Treponema sp.]